MRRMSMRSLPIPRIMRCLASNARRAQRGGTRLGHQRAHALDSAVEPAEDRFANEKMPDIELDDRRDRGDRPDRIEAKPVTGVAFEAERVGVARRRDDALKLTLALRRGLLVLSSFAIGTGMKLDHRRAELFCTVEL